MGRFAETKPFKVDKNGTQYFADWTCRRCGGQGGADQWAYTGYTCYECGGSGRARTPEIYKVYTPEYEAKLEERRAKRMAKKKAERAAQADQLNAEFLADKGFSADGHTWVYFGNTYEIRGELKAAGAKYDGILGWHSAERIGEYDAVQVEGFFEKDDCGVISYFSPKETAALVQEAQQKRAEEKDESQYVGEVGAKIEKVVSLKKVTSFDTQFGTMYIYIMQDEDGNDIVWKSSAILWKEKPMAGTAPWVRYKEGDHLRIKGTVKELGNYKGRKQTVITRCRVA